MLVNNVPYSGACPNARGRQIQKRGIADLLSLGCDHVTESYIDLYGDTSLAKEGC